MENEERLPDSIRDAQNEERCKNRELKTGESFGNYRIVKCLCAGLLGNYYHMQHIRDLHDVAVGVFHQRASGDKKFIKRLEVLQEALSTFDHETIPQVRDCTEINGKICIFLDPVRGQTLSQYFEAYGIPGEIGVGSKPMTRIIALLLGGLGYAHSQGIDHRDLDSDLIYVQDDGSIQILGLGIKAAMGIELFESIVSASVSPLVSRDAVARLNSFDIMSPEYKAGANEDSRVDIYAVGVISYWLLTAQKPKLSKYIEPTHLVEDISPNWNAFIGKSLERMEDQRYQSCAMALLQLKATNLEPQVEVVGFVQRQIDRIPVPKGIDDRGGLAARICRLLLIGLVGITLTAITASFLKVSYTEEVGYSRNVAQRATTPEKTATRIKIKPPVAKVEFIGHKESYITNEGALALSVQPGMHKLRFSAPRHIEQVVHLKIPDQATKIEELTVELKPAWADIEIRTEPQAAVSMLDARGVKIELGVANEEGILALRKGIFAGAYEILITKSGYEPKSLENQSIAFGLLSEIDAPLRPLLADVKVFSQPLGAEIFINEAGVGRTPLDLVGVIPNDQCLVMARLDGFREIDRLIDVEPGADLIIDLGKLVPLSGALRFKISVLGEGAPEPSELFGELEVLVDGEPVNYASNALENIPVGKRTIQLRHPLYTSGEETILIEDGAENNLEFSLSPRPGFIDLRVPSGVEPEIRINGKAIAIEDFTIEVPANEAFEFEMRMRNHLTIIRNFRLAPNETIAWNVFPIPIAEPTEGQNWTLPYLGILFSWIPAGEFKMGSPLEEHARLPNEGPQINVSLTAGYWIGCYEVTQAQFTGIMERNPSQFRQPRHPVENVSWADAKLFCNLLTNFEKDAGRLPEGYVYRLPSEAEWEYAARGGTSTPFSFGEEADASMGNFSGLYPRNRKDGVRTTGGYGTKEIGRYEANAFGLFDVHGNVREWTLEMYNGRLEGKPQVDPKPRSEGERVSVRGGGWDQPAIRVRSAAREQVSPDTLNNALGFRVVLAREL